jgi:GNAT superfamily N-acetyltransferase
VISTLFHSIGDINMGVMRMVSDIFDLPSAPRIDLDSKGGQNGLRQPDVRLYHPRMEIRDAVAEDAPAACEVLRRSISELCVADHGKDATILARWLSNKTPEIVGSWIAQPGSSILVAVEGRTILGVGSVTDKGEINLNYVSPDARFRGVSRALMAALAVRAMERGSVRCTLISSQTARRLWVATRCPSVWRCMTLDLQQRESSFTINSRKNNHRIAKGPIRVIALGGFSYPNLTGNPGRYTQPRGANMATAVKGHPVVTVSDVLDDHARAVIEFGLAAYNDEKTGYRDYRPLAVVVSDPETGEIVGGLFGRTSFGLLFVEQFFLPENFRRNRLGGHVIALAEEEAKRRGCCPAMRSNSSR